MIKNCLNPLGLLAALAMLIVAGCSAEPTVAPTSTAVPTATPEPVPATRSEVLRSLSSRVIVPGYASAAEKMALLAQSVTALCANPGEPELAAAQSAWREARQAWLRTEAYRFGPAMDRRSISLVDWWPIDAEKIDRNLASDEEISTERVSEFLPATQRGLSVAEYLMFGAGSAGLSDGSGSKRCVYLRSVVDVASDEVAGILADWQGSGESGAYADYFDGTGSLALIDSEAEAEVIRSLVFQVRTIANMRLGAVLGIDTQADASAIPSGGADNSREDFISQLEGVAAIYRGADGGMGVTARVASISAETDARMLEAIEAAIAAASALEGSVISQLEANPAQVRSVYDNIKGLQRVLNTEIVSLLGVSVGFSDTDGDS